MKKILYLSVFAVIVFLSLSCPVGLVSRLDYIQQADVSIYCLEYDGDCVNIGIAKEVHSTVSLYSEIVTQCKDVQGVTMTFEGTRQQAMDVLSSLSADIIDIQQLDSIMTVYAHSPLVRGGIVVDGNLVNIQIAYCDGVVHVGSPLILGSY